MMSLQHEGDEWSPKFEGQCCATLHISKFITIFIHPSLFLLATLVFQRRGLLEEGAFFHVLMHKRIGYVFWEKHYEVIIQAVKEL